MARNNDPIKKYISKGDAAITKHGDYCAALNYYLDAAQHVVSTNWHLSVRQKIRSICLSDIDEDGQDELLFGTEGHSLVAYRTLLDIGDKKPQRIWEFKTNDWVTDILSVDINNDGNKEIIVASDKIYVLDCNGNYIMEHKTDYPISAMQILDIDETCQMIVVGDIKGTIKCYDFQFSEIWTLPFVTNGSIIDIKIGDFDGDGKIEVAAASEDKFVYIINDIGEEKDKINVRHWIVNLADCKMKNNKLRLFIGKFTGDTLMYKHKQTNQIVALKQSGILDLKVEYIFDNIETPQFIVGSSDRCLSIFDYCGQLIWAFETGLGQRALSVKKVGDGELQIFVGTESGDVFSYSVKLASNLVGKIIDAYEKSDTLDIFDLKVDLSKLKILRNYIEYNPIKKNATISNLKKYDGFLEPVMSIMEIWFNSCAFVWEYKTGGRIYDISQTSLNSDDVICVGSDDGTLYCITNDGRLKWSFDSQKDLRDVVQGIRGVHVTNNCIFIASTDKSLYKLDSNGIPEWNFCHEDWILYTTTGVFNGTEDIRIFAGTEDGFVLAFDKEGCLLWKRKLNKRIRALSFCKNNNECSYLVVGCDDNKVYILDNQGKEINSFTTPHYVLVVKVCDLDDSGEFRILTGNENGHVHVYDFNGTLLWRFQTDSWVAALDIFKNIETNEIEIIIGSQDNNIYSLNKYGALLWQYEANARVRTISASRNSNRIAFGSYDNCAYLIEKIDRENVLQVLKDIYAKYNSSIQKQQLLNSDNRYLRAFAYLFETDFDILKKGTCDQSEIVIAAIGINLIENLHSNNDYEELLINLLINSSQRVKAVILEKLSKSTKNKELKKIVVARIFSDVILKIKSPVDKIGVFRYWLTITDNSEDILRLAESLIPKEKHSIDEFLLDEINYACLLAVNKYTGDSADYTIIDKVNKIILVLKEKYPSTAEIIKNLF